MTDQAFISARERAPDEAREESTSPLCFLMDDDFVIRQELARELRRTGADVVEFSSSDRFIEMVDDQNPDIIFVNLNSSRPHECVRALWALKECDFSGAVQLFGRCDPKILESYKTVGTDCSLTMLPPVQKPIKTATIRQIIFDRRFSASGRSPQCISLGEALAKNLVTFLYQPKIDLRAKVVTGVELMARVEHPTFGLLTPDRFLKGADEEDLLRLTRMALVNALAAGAKFQQMGSSVLPAINVGVASFVRLPIADLVLMHRPEDASWPGLLLEVTERQAATNIELLKARFAKLKDSGVSIALDNFGLGSAHLSMLNQIPFREVKLDRKLVDGCATNKANANICKSLIQIAHNFDTQAVAVGISAEADLRMLSNFDCDIGQGFLLGKPMTLQQLTTPSWRV